MHIYETRDCSKGSRLEQGLLTVFFFPLQLLISLNGHLYICNVVEATLDQIPPEYYDLNEDGELVRRKSFEYFFFCVILQNSVRPCLLCIWFFPAKVTCFLFDYPQVLMKAPQLVFAGEEEEETEVKGEEGETEDVSKGTQETTEATTTTSINTHDENAAPSAPSDEPSPLSGEPAKSFSQM